MFRFKDNSLNYQILSGLSTSDKKILMYPDWKPVSMMDDYERSLRRDYAFLTPGYDYYLLFNDRSIKEFERQALYDTIIDLPEITKNVLTTYTKYVKWLVVGLAGYVIYKLIKKI